MINKIELHTYVNSLKNKSIQELNLEKENLNEFISFLESCELEITTDQLMTLFIIYNNRNDIIEIYYPIISFDNVYISADICIHSLNEYLLDEITDIDKFIFYWKNYISIYNDWWKISITKVMLPTLLQQYLIKLNDKNILTNIINEYHLSNISSLITLYFDKITYDDYLIIILYNCIFDNSFKDIYIKLKEENYTELEYLLLSIKGKLQHDNNIDINYIIENLRNDTLSYSYINNIFDYIVSKSDIKIIQFYYEFSKELYYQNKSISMKFYVSQILAIIIKLLF